MEMLSGAFYFMSTKMEPIVTTRAFFCMFYTVDGKKAAPLIGPFKWMDRDKKEFFPDF